MRWSEPATLCLLVAASLAGSAVATAWAIAHARRRGMLDQPCERRSHATPTPRGGGIGIALAALAACAWLGWRHGGDGWWMIGAGLLLVAAVGWRDDHAPLPPWMRLLVHVGAGACLAAGLAAQGASTPAALFAFLLVPVLVNAWNFMDGIDGLAATQALLCALGLACVLDGPGRALGVVVAAACLGFLPFNLPRARVFLGDVGSGALGYLVAALVAAGLASRPVGAWPLLLLPACAFLTDSGLTLGWRALRGERWWQPHVQHLYQRLARRRGHLAVTTAYAGWTAAAIGFMLVLLQVSPPLALAGAGGFIGLSVGAWGRLHGGANGGSEGFGS